MSVFNLTTWDHYLLVEKNRIHLFFLQGPRIWYPKSSIGHAMISVEDFLSKQWNNWEFFNTAIAPGSHPNNIGGCWTGSIMKDHDQYYYYYTTAKNDYLHLPKQQILCAVSSDLQTWEHNAEVAGIEIDYKIYEQYQGGGDRQHDQTTGLWYDESWRDPFIYRDNEGGFHALISARVNAAYFKEHYKGEFDYKRQGCIAHAVYDASQQWTIRPPVYLPATAPELEVSQLLKRDDWYYLLFSAHPNNWVDGPHVGTGGTYYVKSREPFRFQGHGKPLYATAGEELYSGRILEVEGQLFFGAHCHTKFRHGGLLAPIVVEVLPNGDLQLHEADLENALQGCP